MAHAQTYEGTPEQLMNYLNRLSTTQKYKMTVTLEEETPEIIANEEVHAMLQDISKMKERMQETDGTETDHLLREARAGAMYNHSSNG